MWAACVGSPFPLSPNCRWRFGVRSSTRWAGMHHGRTASIPFRREPRGTRSRDLPTSWGSAPKRRAQPGGTTPSARILTSTPATTSTKSATSSAGTPFVHSARRNARCITQWFPRPSGSLTGEWTPDYIQCSWVPALLAQAAPGTRLLVLLRDPVERFRSGLAHQRRDRENAHGRGISGRSLPRLLSRRASSMDCVLSAGADTRLAIRTMHGRSRRTARSHLPLPRTGADCSGRECRNESTPLRTPSIWKKGPAGGWLSSTSQTYGRSFSSFRIST